MKRQQARRLVVLEAGQTQIKVRFLKFEQLKRNQFIVPISPCCGTVYHETKCFDFRIRPFVTKDDRDLSHPAFAGRLHPKMAINDFTATANQEWYFATELFEGTAHMIYGRSRMFTQITRIFYQPTGRPPNNFEKCTLCAGRVWQLFVRFYDSLPPLRLSVQSRRYAGPFFLFIEVSFKEKRHPGRGCLGVQNFELQTRSGQISWPARLRGRHSCLRPWAETPSWPRKVQSVWSFARRHSSSLDARKCMRNW